MKETTEKCHGKQCTDCKPEAWWIIGNSVATSYFTIIPSSIQIHTNKTFKSKIAKELIKVTQWYWGSNIALFISKTTSSHHLFLWNIKPHGIQKMLTFCVHYYLRRLKGKLIVTAISSPQNIIKYKGNCNQVINSSSFFLNNTIKIKAKRNAFRKSLNLKGFIELQVRITHGDYSTAAKLFNCISGPWCIKIM